MNSWQVTGKMRWKWPWNKFESLWINDQYQVVAVGIAGQMHGQVLVNGKCPASNAWNCPHVVRL